MKYEDATSTQETVNELLLPIMLAGIILANLREDEQFEVDGVEYKLYNMDSDLFVTAAGAFTDLDLCTIKLMDGPSNQNFLLVEYAEGAKSRLHGVDVQSLQSKMAGEPGWQLARKAFDTLARLMS